MTKQTYLAYAQTGREIEVEQALLDRGISVWCGRKVNFVRKGKKRRAEPEITPKLPNYLFITMDGDQWYGLGEKPIKYLASMKQPLSRDDLLNLSTFKEIVDMDHAEGLRVAERNDAAEMAQFKKGQALIDLRGRFADQALTFRRLVERTEDFPLIEAETEMMGQIVKVQFDPLDVTAKKAV